MEILARHTYIPIILSTLACAINIVPGMFHSISFTTPQEKIENFIRDSLRKNYNQTITQETSSMIFTSLTSLIIFVSIFGSFAGSHWSNTLGRKIVIFAIAPCTMVIGSVVVCLAWPCERVELIFVGRTICGCAMGISSAAVPVYTAEISPPALRVTLGSLYSVAAGVGISLGFVAGLPELLGAEDRLTYLHMIPAAFAGIGPLLYLWTIESPRYVCIIKNDHERSREILRELGTLEEDLEAVIEEFCKEHQEEEEASGFFAAFTVPFYRATIFLSVFLCACWGMSGVIGIGTCLVEFMSHLGMDHSDAQHIAAGAFAPLEMSASILAPIPVHFLGIKRTLLITLCVIFLILTGIFILLLLPDLNFVETRFFSPYYIIVLYFIMTVFHDFGPSVVTVILPPEISPTEIRSLTSGLGNISRSLSQGFGQLYFYPLFLAAGQYALLPFMAMMLSGIIVTVLILPETKGLTINEAVDKWQNSWKNSRLCC